MTTGFDELFKMYQEADENYGFERLDVLPDGVYLVEVAKVEQAELSKNGKPFARLRLTVHEGPFANQNAFVTAYLPLIADPAVQAAVGRCKAARLSGGEPEKKDLGVERQVNASVTLLKVLGVQPARVPEGLEPGAASLAFFNTDAWVGRQFIAGISVETAEQQVESAKRDKRQLPSDPRDRNRLRNWKPMTTENVLEWRTKDLPKQQRAVRRAATEVKQAAKEAELTL